MRILIAADSFKDALPAPAVCAAIAAGLRRASTENELIECPLADGGEGTLAVLARHFALNELAVDTVDPLQRPIRARIGVRESDRTAFVELARASGLQLLRMEERNPLNTSTQGTGKLIAAAIAYGASRIVVAMGGSATSDCGVGIASALGWRFVDNDGRDVPPAGGRLLDIKQIFPPAQHRALPPIDILCDVFNPLFGPNGAAHVYARQKGASESGVERLDSGLRHIAQLIQRQRLSTASPQTPGAGAAGGAAFGAMAFLNATLQSGADYVLNATSFDAKLDQADVVVTGEGRIDSQTSQGKLIDAVCKRAARFNVPVIALCGELHASNTEIRKIGLQSAQCINEGLSMDDALAKTAERLAEAAARLELPSPQPSPGPGRGPG